MIDLVYFLRFWFLSSVPLAEPLISFTEQGHSREIPLTSQWSLYLFESSNPS